MALPTPTILAKSAKSLALATEQGAAILPAWQILIGVAGGTELQHHESEQPCHAPCVTGTVSMTAADFSICHDSVCPVGSQTPRESMKSGARKQR
jgi:hypothetical protein